MASAFVQFGSGSREHYTCAAEAMAPKKDISILGDVQPHGDQWRVEITGVGKGQTRPSKAEAQADLALAQAEPTRERMSAVLRELVQSAKVEASVTAKRLKTEPKPSSNEQKGRSSSSDQPLAGRDEAVVGTLASVKAETKCEHTPPGSAHF